MCKEAYYNEVRDESVEKEDLLKAGHCVEPFKGMHDCAVAAGTRATNVHSRAVA